MKLDLDNPNVEVRVKEYMRNCVQDEYTEPAITVDDIDLTNLAEGACAVFDLYESPPHYDCPEKVFYWAYEVSCEFVEERDEWKDVYPGFH